MGMQGIDNRYNCVRCMSSIDVISLKFVQMLIAKLASKAFAKVSPYFGVNDFAFAQVSASA